MPVHVVAVFVARAWNVPASHPKLTWLIRAVPWRSTRVTMGACEPPARKSVGRAVAVPGLQCGLCCPSSLTHLIRFDYIVSLSAEHRWTHRCNLPILRRSAMTASLCKTAALVLIFLPTVHGWRTFASSLESDWFLISIRHFYFSTKH